MFIFDDFIVIVLLCLIIKSSMFHSLATRNECDAFSSGQFSRSAKDPISPFFFCWQGLRAGIRAILGTVAQCRKSASNPFLALWHFMLKAFHIAHFFTILTHYWQMHTHSPQYIHYVHLNLDKQVHIHLFTVITDQTTTMVNFSGRWNG